MPTNDLLFINEYLRFKMPWAFQMEIVGVSQEYKDYDEYLSVFFWDWPGREHHTPPGRRDSQAKQFRATFFPND